MLKYNRCTRRVLRRPLLFSRIEKNVEKQLPKVAPQAQRFSSSKGAIRRSTQIIVAVYGKHNSGK